MRPNAVRRRAAAIAAACALAGFAGCGDRPAPKEATEAPAPAPPEPTADWKLDERHGYALELRSSYGPADGAPAFELTLTATMAVQPVARDGEAMELLLTLAEPKLTARQAGETAKDLDTLLAELQKPSSFVLDGGRFTTSRIPREANPLVVGVLRTVASALQRAPAVPGQSRWEVTENDATGQYVASVERVEKGLLRKRKLRYTTWNVASPSTARLGRELPMPRVETSLLEIRGDGAAPVRVALDERLATDLGQGAALHSVTSLSLVRRDEAPATPSVDREQFLASSVELAAGAPYAMAQSTDLDRAKTGDLGVAEIIAGLEAQAKQRDDKQQRLADMRAAVTGEPVAPAPWMAEEARFFTALNATLRQKPEALKQVERAIRGGSPARSSLISSLGASGTSGAHELLLSLLADKRLPEDVRNACGWSLIRTPTPSAAAVAGVEARLDDPNWHRMAVYGLGTYARLLRQDGQAAESRRLVELLVARLRAEKVPAHKADLVLGLSNSAAPEILEVARELAADRSVDIRTAVMTSLRLQEGPDAERLLLERLAADSDKGVRVAALRSLSKRAPSAGVTRAVARAAQHDAAKRVRYDAVVLLGNWLPNDPALRGTLETIAKSDAESTIRSAATAGLNGQTAQIAAAATNP